MVETDPETASQAGEVQSSLQSEQQQQQQQPENHAFPSSLGRQSSIYSLTLDEFQHTLCESGKDFGSMNMDEFLSSIWTAEESQAHGGQATIVNPSQIGETSAASAGHHHHHHQQGLLTQPSLSRQGSLTIPPLLCRKTVEEVWAEIHKTQEEQQQHTNGVNVQSSGSTQRQVTFGEMTLEDFLIKAGVVREEVQLPQPPPLPSQPQPYGMYQNNSSQAMGAPFISRPAMPGVNVSGAYQSYPQNAAAEASMYPGGVNGAGVYAQHPPGRVMNRAAGGYGEVQGLAMGSPVSPVASDGLCANQMEGDQYGLDVGGMRGSRKRTVDGPIEMVVERRQRRMIKNRESAARSRARKQAYTIELEAELNQLKEDNAHLRQALAEMETETKQQRFQEVKTKVERKVQTARERLGALRRSLSCP